MLAKVLVLLALSGLSFSAKLPSNFQTCHVNDVEFSTCLAKAIEDALHSLKDGEKTLGIAPIDPLHVDEMTLDLGSGPISIVLSAKDLNIVGLHSTTVDSAELDSKKHVLVVKAQTKHLRLDFQYKATGQILVVPVRGDGPAFFEFDDVATTHVITGEPVERKGKTYWTITDYKVNIEPKKMKCHFTDLIKGNSQVSEQVNGFLNGDWKLFYKQIQGPAQEAFSAMFKQLAGRVFDRVPITDIYQDI
ncbi:protein takeout-like [Frankliniella occidentalis]|uniref:Protein takeout-like n=1 Tax=Frankliniella occidentalis TaxID=133901 RepID=A0A6J1S7F3_FRAOC|nr:protein takeout-like [Frankliniella occidentalis]